MSQIKRLLCWIILFYLIGVFFIKWWKFGKGKNSVKKYIINIIAIIIQENCICEEQL
jgi:hypothetical protein